MSDSDACITLKNFGSKNANDADQQKDSMGGWQQVDAGPADVSQTARTLLRQIRPWYDQVAEADRQKALRERYPALQTAWDNYLMVLRMVENEISQGEKDDGYTMTGDAYEATDASMIKGRSETV